MNHVETAQVVALVWLLSVALVLIIIPGTVYLLWRRGWKRLPESRALTKGPGPSPIAIDDAFTDFQASWRRVMREDFESDRFLVEWVRGKFFYDSDVLDKATGLPAKLAGRAYGAKKIRVACETGARVGSTEFFHECAHAALEQNGHYTMASQHDRWPPQLWKIVEELEERHR